MPGDDDERDGAARARAERPTTRMKRVEKPTVRLPARWEIDEAAHARAAARRFALDDVPHVVMAASKVLGLRLDAKAGFVLSLVDGRTSVEAIADLAGIDKDDAIAVLEKLRADGAIALRPRISTTAAKLDE